MTTGPIVYSTTPATLQANIQAALNATSNVGSGTTAVLAQSATSVTVTFQGTQASRFQNTMLSNGNPQVSVTTTVGGVSAFNISPASVDNVHGLLGVAQTQGTGGPNLNTVGGVLLNIVFSVVGTPGGVTPVYLAQAVTPTGITVNTGLSVSNASYLGLGGVLPVRPQVTEPATPVSNTIPFASFVPGVDGFVSVGSYLGITGTPTNIPAGTPFTFTVTAFSSPGVVNTSYSGVVQILSSDGSASLPASSVLTNGVGTFTVTLSTGPRQLVYAQDTVTAALDGASTSISVTPGVTAVTTHFLVTAPATASAGTPFTYTVTAETAANTTASNYAGTVAFTTSDGAGTVPAPGTLTNGVGVFSATLVTNGSQTITATDTVTSTITGASNAIVVSTQTQTATHFVVSAPSSTVAGANLTFTVTAEDASNATVTTYTGTVHFTTSDVGGTVPANATLLNGVGTFSATLVTASSQTITATDAPNSLTGTSGPITVTAAAATHFTVSASSTATAGVGIPFTVTAFDQFNNVATTYGGSVAITSTDGAATLPANSTLTNGTNTFNATLVTAGSQVLSATDSLTSSITGHSGPITVSAAAATHFTVNAPSSATAGVGFQFTVAAFDQFNNLATTYGGSVKFTSSDTGAATLPANSTLVGGTEVFTATLVTAGSQVLSATDSVTSSITGNSGPITVSAAAATHFTVSAPATETAGVGIPFTVTALDQFGNVATTYGGTVTFSTSDTSASASRILPSNSTLLPNGTKTFTATLATAGNQTLTATDTVTSSITGHSGPILVSAAAATHFSVNAPGSAQANTGFSFVVTALDPFNNTATSYGGTVNFTTSDGSGIVPANSTLTNGTQTFSATLVTAGNQTITATDSVNTSITGHSGPINVTTVAQVATHFVVSAFSARWPGPT